MINQEIAKIFYHLAFFYEMEGVAFKPQAYEQAAISLEALSDDLLALYQKEGRRALEKIPGIGQSLADKIIEYFKTGQIKDYERFKKKYPIEIDELSKVEGLGPKMIKKLYLKLKITNLKQLEEAARLGKIRNLEGFGEKSEKNILESILFLKKSTGRFLLSEALSLAEDIISEMKKIKEIDQITYAGSLRRKKETIGDIDLLATVKKEDPAIKKKIMETFIHLKGVIKVWDLGLTKASVRLRQGLDVDLRLVRQDQFGAALQYFTGSKEHNIVLRKIALEKHLRLNEYGLFKLKAGKSQLMTSKEEKDIYEALGLDYIEPEMRENRGEIELALNHRLPKLVEEKDILGDLHVHSDWDGGRDSLEELMTAAINLGYHYLGIADHTQFLKIEHGLDEKQIKERNKAIDRLNEKLKKAKINFRLLKGCEANILDDGRLDLDDETLKSLDFVIAGIHSGFKNDAAKMTERIIRAMRNPYVHIISHPTGRLIGRRDEYQLDLEKVLSVAKETKTALEINAYPERLDLKDTDILKAVKNEIKLVIDSDSHSKDQLAYLRYGVSQARRGWAQKKDILNTLEREKLLAYFKNV